MLDETYRKPEGAVRSIWGVETLREFVTLRA